MIINFLFIFAILIIEFSSGQYFGDSCDNRCVDGTSCVNNLCQCTEDFEYFPTNGQCAKRVGAKCNGEDPNAMWQWWRCVSGSECDTTTNTCKCTPPYIPTEIGSCTLGLGSYCSKNQPCTPGASLTCVDSRCICGFGTILDPLYYQLPIQQSKLGDCRVKSRDKCTLNGTKCVENAQCIGGECKCTSGYGDDTNRQCTKLHSQSCIPKNIYQTYQVKECNEARGLFCIDDICQCQEPSIWNVEKQACLAGLGEICNGSSGCLDPNAVCVRRYEPRRCGCSTGYIEAQGICTKDPNLSNCGCPSQDGNTFDCTGKSSGNYPLKNDPIRYVQCTKGTGIVHSCPPPKEFNANISKCDIPKPIPKPHNKSNHNS